MTITVENLEAVLERMSEDLKRTENLGNAWKFVVEQSDGAQTMIALAVQDLSTGRHLSETIEAFAAKMLCIGHEMAESKSKVEVIQ